MKKILLTTVIASAVAASAFSQGFVNFSGGGSAATRVSTNSVVGGPATGALAAGAASQYYFALFASTTQTASAQVGQSGSYVFNNMGAVSSAWELVGEGSSVGSLGRFSASSQGTSSSNQGALNTDNSMTVQGVAGGANANFVAIGWSANIGSTLAAAIAWFNAPGTGGINTAWFGQSTVATQTLGDGGLVSTPAWNTSPNFVLGEVVVPEPGTIALAAIGGASLLLFRRKK